MTQKRFWNWQDDDSTNQLSQIWRSFFPSGVFSGFNGLLTAGLNLILDHTANGASYVTQAQALVTDVGILVTKQGTIVQEDAQLSLPISANATGDDRIDLIICEHSYQQIVGGTQATYSVIQGTPAPTPVAPSLTNANIQVPIGELYVPAGTTDLTDPGVVYTVYPVSLWTNDPTIVRTNVEQTVTASHIFNELRGHFIDASLDGSNPNYKLDLTNGGINTQFSNFYYLAASPIGTWAEIDDMLIPQSSQTEGSWFFMLTPRPLRIKGFNTSSLLTGNSEDVYVNAGELVLFINISGQGLYGTDKWAVMDVSNRGVQNKWRKTQSGSKGASTFNTPAGTVTLDGMGNYFEVGDNSVNIQFKFMTSFYQNNDPAGGSLEAGTIVVIRNSGSQSFTLYHNNSPDPSGYKRILLPFNGSVTIPPDAMMFFVEDTGGWRLVSYISSTFNPLALYLNDLADVNTSGQAAGDVLWFGGLGWFPTNLEAKIANEKHVFTKLQSWNNGSLLVASYNAVNHHIRIPENCNSCQVDVAGGEIFADIVRLDTSLVATAVETGTWVAIQFRTVGAPGTSWFEFDGVTNFAPYLPLPTIRTVPVVSGDVFVFYKTATVWVLMSMPAHVMRSIEALESDMATAQADILLRAPIGRRQFTHVERTGQIVMSSIAHTIVWNAVVSDTLSYMNTGNGRFTPLTAGWWEVTVHIPVADAAASAPDLVRLSLFKNGTLLQSLCDVYPYNANTDTAELQGTFKFQANGTTDYFETKIERPAGAVTFQVATGTNYIQYLFIGT